VFKVTQPYIDNYTTVTFVPFNNFNKDEKALFLMKKGIKDKIPTLVTILMFFLSGYPKHGYYLIFYDFFAVQKISY